MSNGLWFFDAAALIPAIHRPRGRHAVPVRPKLADGSG